mgnify:CR=1 FL=1
MAKILVTGGLGFIGHNVVALLESQGHDVVIIDNQTTYGIVDRRELDLLIQERQRFIKTRKIYYVDIAHRCTKYNSKIVVNNNNLWQPGQKGFWE